VNHRNLRLLFSIALAVLATPASAKPCDPSGLFFRSHGDQLKIESVDAAADPMKASFTLIVLGNMNRDAPTVGRAEGEMVLSEDQCLGVYSERSMCTLVFDFLPKSVRIRQIGFCGFGAGAYVDGSFNRTTRPERYLP